MQEAQAPRPLFRGRVKWFSPEKGYGFVETESGRDVFVHYSAIQQWTRTSLQPGEVVEFSPEKRLEDDMPRSVWDQP